LTLISAPAGFGKSTLVSSWLAKSGIKAAWLSLDPGDNDPVRFWSYLVAAFQTIHVDIGEEARQIASTPQLRSIEPAAISLINDISPLAHDLILVLDDYHIIDSAQIHDALSYLLEHQPPNLHLILITRVDPPFSLARLRAHGGLAEVRAGDLQFSDNEATILFNEIVDLNLKPEQVEILNEHAEGWIVSLNLAALTLKGQPASASIIERFTGSHQYILDYLTEEVLEALPDDQRQFLLRTSILGRFCAALCNEVTGNPESPQVLDDLRIENMFLIPLDAGGNWFRYHHLFTEVLNALLERDHPGEISDLHLRASAWFDSQDYPGEAVDHALHSGDPTKAREQVLKHWIPVLHRGEIATVQRWLDRLPVSSNEPDPYVPLARCWALFLSWQNSAIEPYLAEASNAYERLVEGGTLSGAQQNQVAAQLAMMRSVLARDRGEHDESVSQAEKAAELFPQEIMEGIGTTWNMLAAARAGAGDFGGAIEAYEHGITLAYAEGNLIGAYGCTYGQAMYMVIQGRLTEAEKLCRTSIERASSDGHGGYPAAGWLHIAMARIEMERNRLDDAEVYLSDGLRIARPGGFNEAVRTGRYLRAQLAGARGNLGTATEILQETERILNAMDEPYLTGELNREWAMLCIRAGDLEAAREKLDIMEEQIAATQHGNLVLWWGWLFPRLLFAEQHYREALNALDESIDRARAGNSDGELIRLLALQAVVLEALGERNPAHSALREALVLGAPEGYTWALLNAGKGIEPLLRGLRNDSDTSPGCYPYLDSLLDACRVTFGESSRPQPEDLPDLLTPRELEIIRLIGKGYSNPEIASQLVVSLNTVKKHTSNIYSKLGVRSRTQAIAHAQQLKLI
jgi:LuxR family maltose regulon positive regulatory protein